MCLPLVEHTPNHLAGQPVAHARSDSWLEANEAAAQFAAPLGHGVGLGLPAQPLGLKASWSLTDILTTV